MRRECGEEICEHNHRRSKCEECLEVEEDKVEEEQEEIGKDTTQEERGLPLAHSLELQKLV